MLATLHTRLLHTAADMSVDEAENRLEQVHQQQAAHTVHAHAHACMHAYAWGYACVFVFVFVFVCMCVCVCVCVCV